MVLEYQVIGIYGNEVLTTKSPQRVETLSSKQIVIKLKINFWLLNFKIWISNLPLWHEASRMKRSALNSPFKSWYPDIRISDPSGYLVNSIRAAFICFKTSESEVDGCKLVNS